MTAAVLKVAAAPSPADRQAITRGLAAHGRGAHGPLPRLRRWILARDAAGALLGGARCEIVAGWLHLRSLWVEEGRRGQGLGARLLEAAEALARENGCRGVQLATFSFEAPEFYRRHGYREVGRLADMPPGATRYWFAKQF